MAYALFRDPFLEHMCFQNSFFEEFVDTDDGYVALKTKDGKFVSQEPNQYGFFNLAPSIGAYEKFGGGSGIGSKTTWTRPSVSPPDKMFTYYCQQIPNY